MAEDYTTRTPGQILRAAREDRSCSLLEAEEGTKIPKELLEAIERDEYHKLSGPLYVKSFLRNYSGWLGLDAEEILGVYELATGRPEHTASMADEVWSEDQVAVTRVGMPWARLVVIAVIAAVVLAVLVLALLRLRGGSDDESAARPVNPATVTVAEQQAVATHDEPAGDEESEPAAVVSGPIPVQSEVQPTDHLETREERLARLTEGEFAGLPAASTPMSAPADSEPDPAPPAPRLEPPRRGDPELRFHGGATFPLVLRVLMPEPANCTVRRDDQADAVPVIWPENPGPPPAYNLRHGLAYAVQGGYVVYWGAEDHFTLTLDRIRGAEVSLNGRVQTLTDWRPGQTKLLDASRLSRDGG